MADERCIFIIDSPNGQDFITERREGFAVHELLRLRPNAIKVRASLYTVVNKKMLDVAVTEITQIVKTASYYPIIHFSCHALPQGITLTDDVGIKWDELAVVFQPMVKVTGGKLTLCFAACDGIHAQNMSLGGQQVFEALVAPTIKPDPDETAIAFSTLYHLFLTKGVPLNAAVDAMNQAVGHKPGTFQFLPQTAAKMTFAPARR